MEKYKILKKFQARKKMFEEYLYRVEKPGGERQTSARGASGKTNHVGR